MRYVVKISLVVIIVGLVGSSFTLADTIYVNWDGSGDYITIQEGIDAAVGGDEVVVADGTYTGDGNRDIDFLGKAITVRSENGAENCIIDCEYDGRGFYFQSGEDANSVLDGFSVINGYSGYDGGGIYCANSSPTVTNCTFSSNGAYFGGGMYNNNSSPTVTNCTFTDNRAEGGVGCSGGGMFNEEYSNPTVINCTFSENYANYGGGMYNEDSSPTVINCTFSGNYAVDVDYYGGDGGGMFNNSSNPTVINCTFRGNDAIGSGGGMYNWESDATVTNCTFSGNDAYFYGVEGGDGGGMFNNSSNPTVTDCTFISNYAKSYGGGMYNYSNSNPTVTNCIFWDNSSEIYNENSTATVTYSNVMGGYIGTGNIDIDPLFVDPDGPDNIHGTEDDNLHLQPYSPCIDAGDPAGDYTDQTDIDGQQRVLYGRVDMGVDEVFPIAGDIDEDGDIDLVDFSYFCGHWLKGK